MIQTIHTVVQDRRIVVPVPDDLPDGTKVEVTISAGSEKIGIDESEWDDSPDGIKAWIRQYESLEPLILTDADRAEMDTAMREQKEWEKSHFFEQTDKLRQLWE
ncbi:MAG TPA: hypothetical protein PLY87_26055 [Planctomycetaceae bacterium]|nr:hypothetical protein [Planctomycetaceae bacterium]HQZ68590.1 hypothetical protein [Planctomycetaceae bacterium]